MANTSSPKKVQQKPETAPDWEGIDRSMSRVAHQLKKQNSLGWSFARGVMTGLGASIGVTLVLTLVVFAISQIARWFGFESVIQPLVETLQ